MSDKPKAKVVRLSVIKTNAQRRRRRQILDSVGNLKKAAAMSDAIGFTVVFFNRDGSETCYWDTVYLGIKAPIRGELSKQALDRVAAMQDAATLLFEDDSDE